MFSFVAARSHKSVAKSVGSALAAITVAGLVALGVTAPAFATATTGSFNLSLKTYYDHTVEAHPGDPVQGADVSIFHFSRDDGEWEQLTDAQTNSQGQLDTNITGLVVGDKYAVYVSAPGAIDASTSEPVTDSSGWLEAQGQLMSPDFDATSTYFTATAGTQEPIAYLNPGITMTGSVTGQDGNPTTADSFTFYRLTSEPNDFQDWTPYVTDDTAGQSYSVSGLAPGSYIVKATQSGSSGLSSTTFNVGATSLESATPQVIQLFTTPTQDVKFLNAATISGTVSLTPSFNPVAGVVAQVLAFPLDSTGNTDQNPGDEIEADVSPDDGTYSLAVTPGNYDLEFVPAGDAADPSLSQPYYAIWYGNAPYAQQSTRVSVPEESDSATDINGTIGTGLTVSGFVSADTRGRLQGIEVDAVSQFDNPDITTTTDNTGYYQLTLPPDYYNLSFSDPSGTYPDRFYTGSEDGTNNIGLATTFSQQNGSVEADFEYDPYSTLTVHVANKAGTPLSGVGIEAQPMADGSPVPNSDEIDGTPVSGHAGTYALAGLQAGTQYALQFAPTATSGTYFQYWGGSQDPNLSKLYTAGGDDDSIDVTLASSAAVSGVVSTTANKGIKGVQVDLYNFDGTNWNLENYAVSSSTGAYSFPNLATGSYTVQFDTAGTSSYISAWAGGGADAAHATHVYVAQGKPATISQHLTVGGTITGVVGGPGGNPKLSGIEVDPIMLTGTPGSFTAATPDNDSYTVSGTGGKFSLTGLPTGYYALSFDDFSGNDLYGNPYVSPVGNPSSTTPIYHVTAGKVLATTGTIALPHLSDQKTASIVGSLNTSGVAPLGEAAGFVDVFDAAGGFVDEAAINVDGSFSLDLVPGDYTYSAIVFDPDNPQNRFAEQDGSLTATAGSSDLVIPVLAAVPLGFTTAPAIVDNPGNTTDEVGTTYQLNDVTWNHTNATVQYQWLRDGRPIYGAIGTSYTTQGADYGAEITVRVTLTDDYLTVQPFSDVDESVVSYVTATTITGTVTQSDQLFNTASPTTTLDASGRIGVGQTAKAQPGEWNDIPGVSFTYDWVAEGGALDGHVLGTAATFSPSAADADAGGAVRLYVSARSVGYSSPASASDSDSLLMLPLAAPTLKVAPKITAKAVAGGTLYSVTPGTWSVSGTTPHYDWVVGTTDHVSTTNSYNYVPSGGTTPLVSVQVQATKSGYAPGSTTVVALKAISTIAVFGAPKIHDSSIGDVADASTSVPVGSTLTIPSITYGYTDDNTAPTTFTYQWWRFNPVTSVSTKISGATKSSYVVTTADVGQELSLDIFAGSATHQPADAPFDAGTGELRQELTIFPASITAASTNTNAPLTKITDSVSAWGPTTSVTNSYQWLICTDGTCSNPASVDYSAIPKATSASYTPTLAQANDSIALRVIGSKSTYQSTLVYGPVTLVGDGTTISPITKPSISAGLTSGNATFSTKLTAKAGTWDVPGVVVTYDWQISTDGGTSWIDATLAPHLSTYTPVFGDFTAGGTMIRVTQTATKSGYAPATASSAAVPLVGLQPKPLVNPVLTTTPTTWSISQPVGGWPTSGGVGTVTYMWFVDHEGFADSTQTFDRSNVTSANSVELLVEYSGGAAYKPAFIDYIIQKGSAPVWNSPTISGTPKLGNTLSAPTDWSDAYTYPSVSPSASLSYQWYSGTTAIAKATASTFTPTSAYIGKTIKVKITSSSQQYATASNLTAGVLFASGDAPHGSPTLKYTGNVHSGESIGVTLSGYTLTGLTHGYQWQLSKDNSTWVNISGATKPTYVVPPADLGDYLRAVIATTKSGYSPASDPTDSQQIVEPTVLAPITAPTVSGQGSVGSTMTVSPGVWNVTGTTFTYQWFRDGIIIPGATATTFTATPDEFNETLSVQVTARAAGYDAVTYSPNSTQINRGNPPSAVVLPKITGTAKVGSTLTVTPGAWSVDGLAITYQWYYGTGAGTPIDDATSSTFTPDATELGQPVFCIVFVDRDGYQGGQAQSLSTGAVVA